MAETTKLNASSQSVARGLLSISYRRVSRPKRMRRIFRRLRGWLGYSSSEKPAGTLPPQLLRTRVAGTPAADWFDRSGQLSVDDYRFALRAIGRRLVNFNNVLDFGCGCGRVLRWLGNLPLNASVQGCDVDPEAVDWLRANLPQIKIHLNRPLPPLNFQDAVFDLVLCHSVFTHLDENYQDAWLEELVRIAADDAILLISFMGDHAFAQRLPEEASPSAGREELRLKRDQEGLLFLPGGDVGLPEFYQTTYHSVPYVMAHWGQYFEVLAHIERGALGYQDLMVLQRRKRGSRSD